MAPNFKPRASPSYQPKQPSLGTSAAPHPSTSDPFPPLASLHKAAAHIRPAAGQSTSNHLKSKHPNKGPLPATARTGQSLPPQAPSSTSHQTSNRPPNSTLPSSSSPPSPPTSPPSPSPPPPTLPTSRWPLPEHRRHAESSPSVCASEFGSVFHVTDPGQYTLLFANCLPLLNNYAAIAGIKVVPMQSLRSRAQSLKIAALSLIFCDIEFGESQHSFLLFSFKTLLINDDPGSPKRP